MENYWSRQIGKLSIEEMENQNVPSIAVLILSCDAYSDVWSPFFELFFRFWPDCPYKIYLASETLEFNDNRILPLHGTGNWSKCLHDVLHMIKEDHILYLQEDYLLVKNVLSSEISRLNTIIGFNNISCIRLYPAITEPLINIDYQLGLGYINNHEEPFIVSCQASIWKKEILKSLIEPSETGWEFERNGSARAKSRNLTFACVPVHTQSNKLDEGNYPITYIFFTAITRGRWTRHAVKKCKQLGVSVNLKKRKRFTIWDEFYINTAPIWLKHIMDFINSRFIKNFGVDLRYSSNKIII